MAETSGSDPISTKLQRIAELAQRAPGMAFTTLAHLIDVEWLREAYRATRKDGASGIDGLTADEYAEELEENLQSLLERFQSGRYRAPAVREVEIPKADGSKTRTIGIPTFEDKILQRAVLMALEAVYEQDFLDCSYGFRPGRSAHQALDTLWKRAMAMQGGWVLDVDIEDFLMPSSYYPPSVCQWSKSPGRASGTLILRPLRRPRETCTAARSPRLTRCNTVWRERLRMRMASTMGT
jgi:hypothetical protein